MPILPVSPSLLFLSARSSSPDITNLARTPAPSSSSSSSSSSSHTASRAITIFTSRLLHIVGRQSDNSIVPTTYGSIDSGPSSGTVVGIVLGSVGGFLLVLWLIYTCVSFGGVTSRSSYTESVRVRERRKSRHGSTRSRRQSETVEVRRAPSPVRIVREEVRVPVREPERVERVIVEESRETRRERSRGDSDEVVVIEEHSPPRRKKSVREREERERRESGYRTVDPGSLGGAVGGRKSNGRR